MKKICFSIVVVILLILSILVVVFLPDEKDVEPVIIERNLSLMEFGRYKNINVDEIDYIEKIRYTEAGRDSEVYRDTYKINSTYNYLASRKVCSTTTMTCDDNTTVYVFYMNDGKTISIEIECGVLVEGKNRYILK